MMVLLLSKTEIAYTLAETFPEKSSRTYYSPKFPKFQNSRENVKLNLKSDNTEQYNKDSTLKELKKCHDNAVGNGDIHYEFLEHLPIRSLDCLLHIFNQV